MTKEEFEVLQLNLQQSGKSVKDYLNDAGVNYSTYNYWRKKLLVKENPKPELAPISFTQHADPVFSFSVPSGATLLFPNGLRAHFGSGTEDVFIFIGSSRRLMKLLHAEDGGMVMYVKRLEAGRFKLPEYDENTQSYQMEWRDLVVMVEGIQESPDQRLRRLRAQR